MDRQIARWALAERMKRKYPKRSPPRWYDRSDVEMVAICTAAVEGDRPTKEQAQREAIVGAFSRSKAGPPTARFIWGKVAHFFEHVECGKRELRADAREMRWRAPATTCLRAAERPDMDNADELAKTRAKFEQVAAQTPPQFRRTLDRMIAQYRELERKARI